MPRTDLVVELVRAGASGDNRRFKGAAERMISEERAKKNGGVADKLTEALETAAPTVQQRAAQLGGSASRNTDIPHMPAVAERSAQRELSTVRLPIATRKLVSTLIKEQARANELRAEGLEPRHRVLLVGPPGNGKTSLAEAIAAELGRIFLVVRYDGLIASYLGETAQRLRRIFDIARSVPCVLFFDEMDAIAKERGDANETGEIKRVLTSLLTQIDELPATCLLIAATNHPQMLDEAVWRRFQLRLTLPQPGRKDVEVYFKQAIAPLGRVPAKAVNALLEALGPASYSDAEELALSLRRRAVLREKKETLSDIAAEAREEWLLRSPPSWIEKSPHGDSPPSATAGAPARQTLED
jgi:SpoVK/Ycf46/Vps4 family AAA+-type ATPase